MADYTDPAYMKGDSEIPEIYHSSDNFGGTQQYEQGPIAVPAGVARISPGPGSSRRREDGDCGDSGPYGRCPEGVEANYPVFTGGTFLRPEVLPPIRTYHLQ